MSTNSPLSGGLMIRTWGGALTGEGAMGKMPRLNAFSRKRNTKNLKLFPNYGRIYRFERKFNRHSG